MRNIELFDEYTARIFAEMYQAFPVKKSLDARKLCGHMDCDEYGAIVDERGERSKPFEIARATIEWLHETGYIRGREMDSYGLEKAVLSSMGLSVLKSVSASLKIEETTGDRLARLVRDGTYEAAKDLIKSALATGTALVGGA